MHDVIINISTTQRHPKKLLNSNADIGLIAKSPGRPIAKNPFRGRGPSEGHLANLAARHVRQRWPIRSRIYVEHLNMKTIGLITLLNIHHEKQDQFQQLECK